MLKSTNISFGSDPELFATKGGKIIGSERILPETGVPISAFAENKVVQDGVQIELHPKPGSIYGVASGIQTCLRILKAEVSQYPGVGLCFDSVVDVTREELADLGPKSRIFGCMPSFNAYGLKSKQVDPIKYLSRSAGGHIHLTLNTLPFVFNGNTVDQRRGLVPLLDIFVGNTSVLLDRNPHASKRRETYGQAGEFRLPKYGLEYRALSNFWLRDFAVLDLMFGMADFAVAVYNETLRGGQDLEAQLIETVNIKRIIRAIQMNDWDLAAKNFDDVKVFIAQNASKDFPLFAENIATFEKFAGEVKNKGIETVLPWNAEEFWFRKPVLMTHFSSLLNKF